MGGVPLLGESASGAAEGGVRSGISGEGRALTREEVAKLAAKFKAQDEAHAKALAEKDELAAAKDAEIAALREQIKQAQAANQKVDDRDYSEAETRDLFIDVLLAEAGWPLTDEQGPRVQGHRHAHHKTASGYVDYVLWGADGLPLGDRRGQTDHEEPAGGSAAGQAVRRLPGADDRPSPVMFYTNGYEHWIWDDAAGYPPREVQGFYTRDELELMIQRRQTRKPLTDTRDRLRRSSSATTSTTRSARSTRRSPPSSARRCW